MSLEQALAASRSLLRAWVFFLANMEIHKTRLPDRMVERFTIDITWEELVSPLEGVRELLVQLLEDFDAASNGETLPVSLQLIQLAIIAREAEMKGAVDDLLRLKP